MIEALREEYPAYKIVLTFFSPSGYELQKDFSGADYVFYLPLDGPAAAVQFLDIVAPQLILFVKYEFWYHLLQQARIRKIPTLLVSAAFREEQAFFNWYGSFFRKILRCFSWLLVQDEASKSLLAGIGLSMPVIVTGDTRYDRVSTIAGAARELPAIERFKGDYKLIVGGSTWPDDERLLQELLPTLPAGWKMILAPHEIDAAHLQFIDSLFEGEAIRYSAWEGQETTQARVLIIDNMGMLSSLYRYGEIAFIGGGFDKSGIHNVLEPAVFGLPVVMGPVYEKFVEAVALRTAGFAFPVKDTAEAWAVLNELMPEERRRIIADGLADFMSANTGATDRILALIDQCGYLRR